MLFGDKETACRNALRGDVTVGRTTSSYSAGPPSWLDGGFISFGDAAPAMDRVQGFLLYGAPSLYGAPRFIVHPASSFVAMWYPFPPRYLGDEDQDTYKRRRSPFGQRVHSLVQH